MANRGKGISRRCFLTGTAATAAAVAVPRHVLGGPGKTPPSDTITCGLVGCGGQAGEDIRNYIGHWGAQFKILACCDVDGHRLARALQKWPGSKGYVDVRRGDIKVATNKQLFKRRAMLVEILAKTLQP